MIQATITGRLGADPEKKTTPNGRDFVSIRVASNNRRDSTTWVRCSIWREKLGEFVLKNCRTGARVCVAGTLEMQSWGDNDENKALELDANVLELYDWPEGATASTGAAKPSKPTGRRTPSPAKPSPGLPF